MKAADLQRAIDLALAGDWEQAHEIVQQDEADPTAAWIHAVIHKIEGDRGNAGYWYRRAGRPADEDRDPQDELGEIRESLKTG
jgi:hypothetical protein